MAYTESQLLAEKRKHDGWLQQQPGVVGTGIGHSAGGELCIKIYTDRMPQATKQQIQNRLQGIPVDFEESGELETF